MIRALLLALAVAGSALAVQPDEILPDPALEARARAMSAFESSIDSDWQTTQRSSRVIARARASRAGSGRISSG